jgi:hypothetical protein
MTKLDKPLRREITIGEASYTLTISPDGLKLTKKGHRNGRQIAWNDLAAAAAAPEAGVMASMPG